MISDPTITRYLEWVAIGHSPATVSSYKYGFFSLQRYLDQIGKPALGCTLDDFVRYMGFLGDMGLKSKTRAQYATCLRSMWAWLEKQGLVPFAAKLIPMPNTEDTERRPYVTQEDYERILATFDEYFPLEMRNKAVVAMLFSTGVRLGELLSMDVGDIDMENRRINIKTFKRKNHWRDVYWNDATHAILLRWLDTRKRMVSRYGAGSDALFIGFNTADPGKRMERHAVQKIFRSARAALGIEKHISPHSCRHGFATKGVKNNINVVYLKEMLGHANLKNTMVYTHTEEKDVHAEYRKVFGNG